MSNESSKLRSLFLYLSLVYAKASSIKLPGLVFHTRRGSTVASVATKGVALFVEVIMLTISAYITALLVPGALTAIATTALTSVSGAVQTLFQTILSIVIVSTIIMLYLGVVVETFRAF